MGMWRVYRLLFINGMQIGCFEQWDNSGKKLSWREYFRRMGLKTKLFGTMVPKNAIKQNNKNIFLDFIQTEGIMTGAISWIKTLK